MYRLTSLIVFILFYVNANAQEILPTKAKNGEFFLTIGIENRITPIHIDNIGFTKYDIGEPIINEDKHLSGTALAIGFAYQLSRTGTTFTLEYAARYDYLYEIIPSTPQVYRPEKGFFSDIHIRIFQPLRIKKFILKPGAGYTFMNRGTEYIYFDGQKLRAKNLMVNPFDLSVGTEFKNLLIDLRCYFIEELTEKSAPLIILPEIKLAYRLGL